MRKNRERAPSPYEGMTGDAAGRGKATVEPLVPPLTPEDVENLVIHLMLCPTVREVARDTLLPELFSAQRGESGLAAVVRAVNELADNYPGKNKIPYSTLRSRVSAFIDADPSVDDECRNDILSCSLDQPGLLDMFYHRFAREDLDPEQSLVLLQNFLQERLVGEEILSMADSVRFGMPADTTAFIERVHNAQSKVANTTVDPFTSVLFDGSVEAMPVVEHIPTGCPFFDEPLGGGLRPRTVNGLIGMVHAGKSTLTAQIAEQAACYFYGRYLADKSYGLRRVFIFSYEDSADEVNARIWSCGARVHSDSLKTRNFSRTGSLKPYEIEIAKRDDVDFKTMPGEYDRLRSTTAKLNDVLTVVDMNTDGRGGGGIREVVSLLKQAESRKGWRPGLVLIDYANAMVSRAIYNSGRKPADDTRHEIKSLASMSRTLVASPYDIPVWIMQQFATRETAKRWDATLHASQAAECSAFFEPLDSCFTLGNRDPKTHVAYVKCDKSRGTDGVTHPRAMVQLQGDFSRFVCAEGRYSVVAGRPVSVSEASQIQGEFALPPARRRERTAVDFSQPWREK